MRQRIEEYLTSPRARRLTEQPNHCLFCEVNAHGESLETHLKSFPSCRQSYVKKFKLRKDDSMGILLKIYSCINCASKKRLKLKNHILRYLFYLNFLSVTYNSLKAHFDTNFYLES